jgi:hypothetical protein
LKSDHIDARRAVLASWAGATAFLATTFIESKLSSHPYNDIKLVGQMLTTRSPLWQIQGVVGHYGFATVMGLLYARYERMLHGPGWLRGLLFMQIENTVLYPLGIIVDRFHRGEREGQLPPIMSRKSYQGQVLRHVAMGVVMGAMLKRKT